MRKYTTLAVTAASLLILNACGGSSDKPQSVTGKLIDAPVAGAEYSCGEIHAKTASDGSFECHSYPVSFNVGGVMLGTIQAIPDDGYVTPQDLLGVTRDNYSAKVQNMAMFIQSLDDDSNIQERITLDPNAVKKLKDTNANMQTINYEQTIDLLEKAGVVHIVSKEEATRHLQEHLAHLHTNTDHNRDHDTDHNGEHNTDHDNQHNDTHDNVHNTDHDTDHDNQHNDTHDNVHNTDHNTDHNGEHKDDHTKNHSNEHGQI